MTYVVAEANSTLQKVQEFDADDSFFAIAVHNSTLLEVVEYKRVESEGLERERAVEILEGFATGDRAGREHREELEARSAGSCRQSRSTVRGHCGGRRHEVKRQNDITWVGLLSCSTRKISTPFDFTQYWTARAE